jgi:hypothetical protein
MSKCIDMLRGGRSGLRIVTGTIYFYYYFLQCVQTGPRVHPASDSMGTGFFFHGDKGGRDVTFTTHLHTVQRLKISGAILLLPLCVYAVHKETFTFTI